jgi:hypothetical protein
VVGGAQRPPSSAVELPRAAMSMVDGCSHEATGQRAELPAAKSCGSGVDWTSPRLDRVAAASIGAPLPSIGAPSTGDGGEARPWSSGPAGRRRVDLPLSIGSPPAGDRGEARGHRWEGERWWRHGGERGQGRERPGKGMHLPLPLHRWRQDFFCYHCCYCARGKLPYASPVLLSIVGLSLRSRHRIVLRAPQV